MKQRLLAIAPIAVHMTGLAVSWFWATSLFPSVGYPIPSLAALIVLAIGAARGVLAGFPVWSITWIVFFIAGVGVLAQALVLQVTDRPFGGVYLASWLAVFLAVLAAVLAFAALLSRRSMPLVMFAILIYLARTALAADIRLFGPISGIVSWLFASAVLIEAGVVMLLAARFVRRQDRQRYLYLLAAVVFLDAFLTALSVQSWTSSLTSWERTRAISITIGGTWLAYSVIILLAWGVSKLTERPRRQDSES